MPLCSAEVVSPRSPLVHCLGKGSGSLWKGGFLPCTEVLVTMQSGSPGRLQHRGPSPSPSVLCPFLLPPSPTHAHSYSLGSGKRRGLLWELLVQFGEVFLYAVIVQIHVATEIKCLEGEAAGCENSP